MNPDQARHALSPSRIRDTVIALAALDVLQAYAWEDKYEKRVRETVPHGESTLVSMATKASKDFLDSSMPGNAQGLGMHVNAFVKGLKVAGLEPETTIAIEACSHPELTL